MRTKTKLEDMAMDALMDHFKANGVPYQETKEPFIVVFHNCKTDEDCQELIDWLKKHPDADKEKILLHVYCRRDGIKED